MVSPARQLLLVGDSREYLRDSGGDFGGHLHLAAGGARVRTQKCGGSVGSLTPRWTLGHVDVVHLRDFRRQPADGDFQREH